MSVDAFLRALQRDVAWDFFYGTVNFDGVFGTVNHYGNVDLFAGRYNDAYRKAELDHVENFDSTLLRETFKAMLDDWTNAGFDPFASPAETGKPFGVKNGYNTAAVTRRRVTASAHGRRAGRRADPHRRHRIPINRMFADVTQDEPRDRGRARLRERGLPPSTCSPTCQPLATSPGTLGRVSVCKDSLYCPTTEEYILPVIHGNDRVEWFVQLSDEIIWDVRGPRHGRRCAPRS